MHDEVEELARVNENDEHHDHRHQRRVESVTRDGGSRRLGRLGHHGVESAAGQRRRAGGTTQALGVTQSLDQSDVEERQQDARDEETHRRLDPVEHVAGPGDVAERTEVDQEVLVRAAVDWRQHEPSPRSAEVRRPGVVGEVVPRSRGEVDPDVVGDAEGHQLRVVDQLGGRVVAGGRQIHLLEQTGSQAADHLRLEAKTSTGG